MIEEEIKQEVREQIAYTMWLMGCPDTVGTRQGWKKILNMEYWLKQADPILSIPNLAIINPKAELPDSYSTGNYEYYKGYCKAQQDMISQGWVKRIGGEECQ